MKISKHPWIDTGLGKVYRKVRTNHGLRVFSHTEWDDVKKELTVVYKHATKKMNAWRTERLPLKEVRFGTVQHV